MKAVLKCRLSSGKTVELTAYNFAKCDFKDSEIISGEKYYIDKAVSLGAKAPVKRASKSKSEE